MNTLKNLTAVQILGIILVINGALIGSTAQLTDLMGANAAHIVVSVCSLGNAVLGGLVTMFSGQGAQIKAVAAMPGVEKISVNSQANTALATIAVSNDAAAVKVEATPAAEAAVTKTANAA
jgi:hypothetical protein